MPYERCLFLSSECRFTVFKFLCMKSHKISNKGTEKLFQNTVLERLTRTNFLLPVIMYFVAAILILYFASKHNLHFYWRVLFWFPFGILIFTLTEYLIHRFLFHFEARDESESEFKYKIHGVHHAYPRDKDRLAMPPVISILLAILFYFLFKALLAEEVLLFFPGFLSGYSIYLMIHFAVHRYRPPRNFLKILWTHHALHHYKDENSSYAVSMPIWDYIFRTLPQKNKSVADHSQ